VIESAAAAQREAARATEGAPAGLAEALGALAAAWKVRGDTPLPEAIAAFRRSPDTSGPRLRGVRDALDREVESLRLAAQLPPVKPAQRQSQQQSRQTLGLWIIDDTLRSHDLRWLTRMRDMDLTVARDLVAATVPLWNRPDAPARLALDYATLTEMRARQLASERRRNQGIAFLEGDSGPRLRLPKHIADEFFRARNRKPPEQFSEWSEAYYQRLYQDVGR